MADPAPIPSRLFLSGIQAEGRHGANPGEKDALQTFLIDLEVVVEVGFDDLPNTADYDEIVAETRRVVADESYELIETLSASIGAAVFGLDTDVMQVLVTVHKPAAAAALGVQDVAARSTFPPETEVQL